ncbi:hypothetical protein chiPu_0032129, partial [Chiloscyllium punctatum]|nr:hypothetical protein [Chiloscyllium punctatum]
HRDLERRQCSAQLLQDRRQQEDAGGRASAEPYTAGRSRGLLRDGVDRRTHRGVDLMRVREQGGAGGGRPGPSSDPLDQGRVQALFELAHLQAHRRLGQLQPLGCGGEAAAVDHDSEAFKIVEVKALHQSNSYASYNQSKLHLYSAVAHARAILTAQAGRQDGGRQQRRRDPRRSGRRHDRRAGYLRPSRPQRIGNLRGSAA